MSKFCFFLATPPINYNLNCIYVGTTTIPNHLKQSFSLTNQEYWAAVRSNLLHSFFEVHNCVVPFTSHGKLHEFGIEKPISWAKPTRFDLLTINFTVWSHILSTFGDALSSHTQHGTNRLRSVHNKRICAMIPIHNLVCEYIVKFTICSSTRTHEFGNIFGHIILCG